MLTLTILLITLAILFSIYSVGAKALNHQFSNEERLAEMRKLVKEYKQKHGAHILPLLKDSPKDLCSMKLVVTDFLCKDYGNFLAWVLDNFLWAVVFDRTFVFLDPPKNCFDGFSFQDWVIDYSKFLNIIRPQADDECQKKQTWNHYYVPEVCEGYEFAEEIWNGRRLFAHGARQLLDDKLVMSKEARKRASILMSNSHDLAAFEVYGLLIEELITFHPTNVIEKTSKQIGKYFEDKSLLKPKPNTLLIAVHARHYEYHEDVSKDAFIDKNYEDCVDVIRSDHPNEKCVLLVASDRLHTIKKFEKYGEKVGCDVIYPERPLDAPLSIIESEHERGPWRNLVPILDWHLVAHAQHIVGNHRSTFTILMGQSIVWRASERNQTNPDIVGLHYDQNRKGCKPFPMDPISSAAQKYDPSTRVCVQNN